MAHEHVESLNGVSFQAEGTFPVRHTLPQEVPVAMVYDGTTLAVMMASPQDVLDFAYGFALSEGIVSSLEQIERHEIASHTLGIEARFWLREDRRDALKRRRRTMAGPVGCGLCGIESLEQAVRKLPVIQSTEPTFSHLDIATATDSLSRQQPLYRLTGATHGAGFMRPGEGVILVREDVGRHNALDKVIGALASEKMQASTGALVLTSRLSVELVQKCAMAGCSTLIAVSAPTAHAQQIAQTVGITLVAFARGGGFDVYSHPDRIKVELRDVP